MIRVTRMGGQQVYLNSDHIEWIESTPDTNIVLQSGKRVICSEAPNEIISRIVDYRRRISLRTDDERGS